jgi:hypothetical protein
MAAHRESDRRRDDLCADTPHSRPQLERGYESNERFDSLNTFHIAHPVAVIEIWLLSRLLINVHNAALGTLVDASEHVTDAALPKPPVPAVMGSQFANI